MRVDLRAEEAYAGFENSPGYWAVSKHEDVAAVSKNSKDFSTHENGAIIRFSPDMTREQVEVQSVMLINQNTGDQYDCGSVPTVPDNAPEIATCPVLKDQIASGDFLIIAVGNNGNGTPFAYQREFNISAGPQQTTTYYYTPTVTSTPIVITTCKPLPNQIST